MRPRPASPTAKRTPAAPLPPAFSVLFESSELGGECDGLEEPDFFRDLNLDQVFAAVVGKDEYRLAGFFRCPLSTESAVRYRQEVFRDLESGLLARMNVFVETMGRIRNHLVASREQRHAYEKASWFLDGGNLYCGAILALNAALTESDLRSEALQRCGDYIRAYTDSEAFQSLLAETRRLKAAIAEVDYCVRVRGPRVTVTPYRGEPDYSAEVLEDFSKFQQGDVESRLLKFTPEFNNHIQEQIVELVARLYPDLFEDLVAYHHTYARFLNPVIERFDREVQFYVTYLRLVELLKRAALSFCYPTVSSKSRQVAASDTFDIALANRRVAEEQPVVVNDFELKAGERLFVVSGPNQGGKTTFARIFGQLHYLARLGCPVPGTRARLFLCDRIFSHFEKQEQMEDLHGKLEEELLRVRDILRHATDRSVVVMNESLASTTARDAHFLGREVIGRLIGLGALAVYVTFIDELSRLGPSVVSMVSTVVPENPAERTFKVVRRPADGRAYATAIAQKYGLTYLSIEERVRR